MLHAGEEVMDYDKTRVPATVGTRRRRVGLTCLQVVEGVVLCITALELEFLSTAGRLDRTGGRAVYKSTNISILLMGEAPQPFTKAMLVFVFANRHNLLSFSSQSNAH